MNTGCVDISPHDMYVCQKHFVKGKLEIPPISSNLRSYNHFSILQVIQAKIKMLTMQTGFLLYLIHQKQLLTVTSINHAFKLRHFINYIITFFTNTTLLKAETAMQSQNPIPIYPTQ